MPSRSEKETFFILVGQGRNVLLFSARRDDRTSAAAVDRPPPREYASSMDYSHLITVEPGKRSGQPCVRGMRITVRDVLEYLAGGMTVEELLADFPELTAEDVRACLAYAANDDRTGRGFTAFS